MSNKMHHFVSYNNLALILDQERKHWLLKTDKKKKVQDNKTGDMYLGKIDNLGSRVIIETEKLPIKYDIVKDISFHNSNIGKILTIEPSAFTYSNEVDGLMFTRIISTNFQRKVGTENTFNHYKIKFENCVKCIIPFASSEETDEVYSYEWIKTTTPPKLLLLNNKGEYSIEYSVKFDDNITNTVFYYPLTESLQPLDIFKTNDNVYVSEAVNDDGLIGYPLYWFLCDQTKTNHNITVLNNLNPQGVQLTHMSTVINNDRYNTKIYVCINGENSTPDRSNISNYEIRCMINNTNSIVDVDSICFYNKTSEKNFPIEISCNNNLIIKLTDNSGWIIDGVNARVDMLLFESNIFSDKNEVLKSVFDIIDNSNSSNITDTGNTGIIMNSSDLLSGYKEAYPYDLNMWDGIPEWMNEIGDNESPSYMCLYTIHNTPTYVPTIPTTRQVAALLFDPGQLKSDDSHELSNNEKGRIYLLSNDKAEYENNSSIENPKPARTVARICDIPTSVMQLSGIHDIAPISIVDKKYVRSETSFKIEDKDRLYNILGDRWVKPKSLSFEGLPITDMTDQDNDYVFNSLELLNEVDLIYHNDYRKFENLNPIVNPNNVDILEITDEGSGYVVDDIGVVVIGGFAFHYTITDIGNNGNVKNASIIPATSGEGINISNFDIIDDGTGTTSSYGTSPLTGLGKGLKFRIIIKDFNDIKPYKGEIFDDLYAFVKDDTGMWLCNYIINDKSEENPKTGKWEKSVLISLSDNNLPPYQTNGGISLLDSYMNSIIPSMRNLPVSLYKNKEPSTNITVLSTPSFVNIIDKTKSPIAPSTESKNNESDRINIDMCKFYCDGIMRLKADYKTEESVIETIKTNKKVRFDSYVFWRWDSKNDINNLYFTFGIIHHSFNNLLTTDSTTTLPENSLICNNYVHSNAGTTIVWDVDNVGVMMWTYNPMSHKHESYIINSETQDLNIIRKDITWEDIDIRNTNDGIEIKLVEKGRLGYNILTNNPLQTEGFDKNTFEQQVIYQQSELYQHDDLKLNSFVSEIIPLHQPIGNWQLVFPRINTFKLINDDGREFTPVRMNIIKNRNIGKINDVKNAYGKNVNSKSVVIDETSEGLQLKIFNSETGIWEKI